MKVPTVIDDIYTVAEEYSLIDITTILVSAQDITPLPSGTVSI